MDRLRVSPYVLDVSPSIVHFSAEFKQLFWESLQSGKEPAAAVQELGIDPEILGKPRVMGLRTMVRNEVRAGKGFRDLNTYGKYQRDLAKLAPAEYYDYLTTGKYPLHIPKPNGSSH